jgi:hypothetical protein
MSTEFVNSERSMIPSRLLLGIATLCLLGVVGYRAGVPASAHVERRAAASPGACSLSALKLTVTWHAVTIGTMAAGAVQGTIAVTRTSPGACRVSGAPTVRLYDSRHHALPVRDTAAPRAEGQPASVIVRTAGKQSQRAQASLDWRNWCKGAVRGPLLLGVRLASGGTQSIYPVGSRRAVVPACTRPSARSTVKVGSFARSSG